MDHGVNNVVGISGSEPDRANKFRKLMSGEKDTMPGLKNETSVVEKAEETMEEKSQ
jgi:hypothetical protein